MQSNSTKKWQLSQEERVKIETLLREWLSGHKIGERLWRDPSVISREILRNWVDKWRWNIVYIAKIAEEKRLERRHKANKKHVKLFKDKEILRRFEEVFKENHEREWVDEIIGNLRFSGKEMVSTSTMYRFIHTYKKEREYRLRYGKHWYKKRKGKKKKTAVVRVPLIEEREEEINNRETLGDWEVDMVAWPKWEIWGLLTLVERKTRLTIIEKLKRGKKQAVYDAIIRVLSRYKVNSITSDNWSEFAMLAEVWKTLWCKVFRCHPYSSREKWGNERNNGIIRWFCPKWLSIQQYSEEYIKEVETKINNKHRKKLHYQTALEVFTYYLNRGI